MNKNSSKDINNLSKVSSSKDNLNRLMNQKKSFNRKKWNEQFC